jgi:NAD-dependent SIR2 family protein deacetylase
METPCSPTQFLVHSQPCVPGPAAANTPSDQGWVGGVVTQNVDRLHSRAGSREVLELHGTSHE